MSSDQQDAFTQAYIEAMFFTDTGEEGQPAADARLAPATVARACADCKAFQEGPARGLLHEAYARTYTPGQAGHDLWLTRNGHGAGFWDRPELESGALGDRLSKLAKALGHVDLYAGDDGLLWLSPNPAPAPPTPTRPRL